MATGVSFGGGQARPMNVQQHGEENDAVLCHIASTNEFRRIAGFASRGFLNWAPRVHERYTDNLAALERADESLARPFPNAPWAAATFNFGPQTVCLPHLDSANLPWGWCAITALGRFNPDAGGHLVLWDYGLVIQCPPGSTILIPSAIVRHSNIPILEGEQRFSFTMYSAGGLFRWVSNGHRSELRAIRRARKADLARREEERSQRWQSGYALFKKYLAQI
ncbi:hypothetical protein HGRIS_000697 [Hohenbuehelia grisea]|uniref:Uncharacterized protein n=1 Tax=Hohenbuehelia grisea TaxID=104357 RepID=A0ABR3JS02_9AGAR